MHVVNHFLTSISLTTLTALLITKVQVINQLFYVVKVVNEIHVKKVTTLHFCVNENVV